MACLAGSQNSCNNELLDVSTKYVSNNYASNKYDGADNWC
jgi:hypothetical protein